MFAGRNHSLGEWIKMVMGSPENDENKKASGPVYMEALCRGMGL